MGVLPLQFSPGQSAGSLELTGEETRVISAPSTPGEVLTVTAKSAQGKEIGFKVTARIDTDVELNYCRNGGIPHSVLRKIAARSDSEESPR